MVDRLIEIVAPQDLINVVRIVDDLTQHRRLRR